MKILAKFKCVECNREVERRIENNIKEIECECDGVMVKLISAARYNSNTVGLSPSRHRPPKRSKPTQY